MQTYGNLALKPAYKPEYQPEQARIYNQNKSKRTKKQSGVNMLTVAVYMVVVFLAAFLLISREVSIYEKNAQINTMQNQLEELQTQTKQASLAAEEAIDLKNIEEVAYTKYGMVKPEKSQTVYINIKPDDYVSNVSDKNVAVKTAAHVRDSVTNLFGIFSAR